MLIFEYLETQIMINVRKATTEDLQAVLNLVIELAIYEKEPDAVTATLEDYQLAFDEQRIQILVAEDQGRVVGMALYYLTFSTWKGKMMYLEDFVVTESYRRKGVGELIWDALTQDSKEQNCILLKWQVLDWNEPAIKFYKKVNATIEKEWWNGKIYFEKYD